MIITEINSDSVATQEVISHIIIKGSPRENHIFNCILILSLEHLHACLVDSFIFMTLIFFVEIITSLNILLLFFFFNLSFFLNLLIFTIIKLYYPVLLLYYSNIVLDRTVTNNFRKKLNLNIPNHKILVILIYFQI